MSNKLIIHHAATEIGGNAIEFCTKNTRILFDLGLPLEESKTQSNFLQIEGLFKTEKPSIDAIVLSHSHMDHFGLIPETHPDIPVYTSYGTSRVLPVISRFVNTRLRVDRKRIHNFNSGEPFKIGDFTLTALDVDHSAYGSCAFVIQAGNKTAFYSGDLRAHGRKPGMWQNLLKTLKKTRIDLMLLEGTTVGGNHASNTEIDVEKKAVKLMRKTQGLVLLQFSPLNIDRLVSFLKASMRSGRILVLDIYTACLLHVIVQAYPKGKTPYGTINMPNWHSEHFRILPVGQLSKTFSNVRKHKDFNKQLIDAREINKAPEKFSMIARPSHLKNSDFKEIKLSNGKLFYSMWSGYRKQKHQNEFENKILNSGISEIVEIHSSGHIQTKDMQKLLKIAKPEILIPIHSSNPEDFQELYDKKKIKLVANGEIISW